MISSAMNQQLWSWKKLPIASGEGAKPLLKTMQENYDLNQQEQMSMKLESNYSNFVQGECIWKRLLQNGGHFVPA